MDDLLTRVARERGEVLGRAQKLVGSTLLGAYRVEEVLGAGTYGVTVKAQDTMARQPVAIKWIYRVYREAVQNELEVLAEVSDLSCVPRYRHWREEGGEFYLVMDYIGGGDLRRVIERGDFW